MSTEIIKITEALNKVRIKGVSDIEMKSALSMIIWSIFELAGQKPEQKDVNIIVKEASKEIRSKYSKTLTLKEIEFAFRKGVFGDYGDYFGINTVTIMKWLKAYYNSEERREAQRRVMSSQLSLEQKTEPTDDEKRKIVIDACTKAWELAKSGEYVKDRGNTVYDFLAYERGIIHFTIEEKKAFMEQAKKELESEARGRSLEAVQTVEFFIEKITANGIIARAKRIALNAFFTKKLKEDQCQSIEVDRSRNG
jgi:hypothetical protein